MKDVSEDYEKLIELAKSKNPYAKECPNRHLWSEGFSAGYNHILESEAQQKYTSELAMCLKRAKARNVQIISEIANQDELLRDQVEPKQIVKNDFRTFLNSKAVFTWDKIDMIVRFVEEYSQRQQPKENKSASKLISDMAEWSRKYPRDRVYNTSKLSMDDELIKLEERAKEIDEYLKSKAK